MGSRPVLEKLNKEHGRPLTLTRRRTKQTMEDPDTYTILLPYTDFDFLDTDRRYYDIEFRIVRLLDYYKIADSGGFAF